MAARRRRSYSKDHSLGHNLGHGAVHGLGFTAAGEFGAPAPG